MHADIVRVHQLERLMRIRTSTARILRILGRKPVRTRIGWRVVIFLLAAGLVTGCIAMELNLRLQTWERQHPHIHAE